MLDKLESLKEEYYQESDNKFREALAKRTLEFMKESITKHPEKDKLDRTELERLDKLRKERIIKIDVKHGKYKNEDLEIINYDSIYFIAYSEIGAMGEATSLNIIEKNGDKIEINSTCFKDNVFDVRAFFENINGLEKILFCGNGNIKGIEDGWNYIYMGCGNNLLIRKSAYKKFAEITKGYEEFDYECYYQNIAIELLNELK